MPRVRLLVLLCFVSLLVAAPLAHGASSGVVLSQVYAGGGNSGATYTTDFVELFNRGAASVDLSGWTIQYASAAGTTWSATALAGTMQPGRYYLVQLASGGAAGTALPSADATGTTNLATTGGKVALVHDPTPLTCGASAGSCSTAPLVEDLVGYGSASDYEGTGAAPALSATTAAVRAGSGCTDTDSNSADFSTATPAARNSSTGAFACSMSASVSQGASVDVTIQPVLSIALERTSVSFGGALAGDLPAPVSEHVTVVSNGVNGYALTVHRSAFAPDDLPLGISTTAPVGTQLGGSLVATGLTAVPVVPAPDLLLGSSTARSATSGDVWPASLGFTSPLPAVAAGRYTATVTFTVIGR